MCPCRPAPVRHITHYYYWVFGRKYMNLIWRTTKKKSLSFLEIVIESRPQCLLFSVTCWCRRLGNKQKWWRPRGIGGCRGQTGRWQQTRSRVQPNCIVFVLFSSLLWPFIRSFLHATIPFPSKYIKRHGGRLGEEQLEEENSPKKNASQCFPEKSTISKHSSVVVADHKRSLAVPSWCWAVSLKFTVRLLPVMLSPRYPLALFLLLLSSHCQHCSQLRPQQFSTDLDQNAALQTNSLIDSDLQLLSLLVNATLLASNTQLATTEDPELDMTTVNSNPKLL